MSTSSITIRPSTSSESDALQIDKLMDSARRWLLSFGSTQWGTSADNPHHSHFRECIPGDFPTGQAWYAVTEEDRVVGAMVLGEILPSFAPRAQEGRRGKEAYLMFLSTDREFKGNGVGAALLTFGKEECRRRGFEWLRGDCYRAVEEEQDKLVKFYESQGFVKTGIFELPDKHEPGLLFTGWYYELKL